MFFPKKKTIIVCFIQMPILFMHLIICSLQFSSVADFPTYQVIQAYNFM